MYFSYKRLKLAQPLGQLGAFLTNLHAFQLEKAEVARTPGPTWCHSHLVPQQRLQALWQRLPLLHLHGAT
jgi:hypothetical protein